MDGDTPVSAVPPPPGTEQLRRFRPKLRYELIGCGLHGHELLGTDAAALRPEDAIFTRESGGLRWYRCLRCDSWIPLSPPDHPARPYPPQRSEVQLPLRGRPLRDRYVLRLVAVDRVLHFVVLSALAAAVFVFASNKAALDTDFTRALKYVQGGLGGPMTNSNHGIVHDLQRLFGFSIANLYLAGAAIGAYAVLEGVEAVGLWFGRRWAEYLTFIATIIFVPYEVYELTKRRLGAEAGGVGAQPGRRGVPADRQAAVRAARRRPGRAGLPRRRDRLAADRARHPRCHPRRSRPRRQDKGYGCHWTYTWNAAKTSCGRRASRSSWAR